MSLRWPGRAALGAAFILMVVGRAGAAGDIRELKWADLVPPADAMQSVPKPKALFPGAQPPASAGLEDESAPPPPLAEGKFMSTKRRQPGGGGPPKVVADLDGKRISIGGYVVPLDFDATSVKEFLLVPFVGACIHVPPPPANQIIYIKAESGFDVTETFEPVTVTGTIKTTTAFTGLADAGYTIEAETVLPRKE